jgi:hypothetical protein
MPFKSLSARMLSMFIAQFSFMLRFLAIAMTSQPTPSVASAS